MNPSHSIPLGGAKNTQAAKSNLEPSIMSAGAPTVESQASQPEIQPKQKTPVENGDLTEHHISQTFPQKLMEMLENEANSDTIAWLPNGKGFVILKRKKFEKDVLPRYFKKSQYASFTRKLNRWGFSRVTKGQEAGSYYHKLFERGNSRLCAQMSCQGVTQMKMMLAPSPTFLPGGVCLDPQELHRLVQLQQLQIQQLQEKQKFFSGIMGAMPTTMLDSLAQQQQPVMMTNKTVSGMSLSPNAALAANAHLMGVSMPPPPGIVQQGSDAAQQGTGTSSPPSGVKRASAA